MKRRDGWALAFAIVAMVCSCGGSSDGPPPAGRAAASIGPSGGVLRGPIGSSIGGVEVTVPEGALESFVELAITGADPVDFRDTGSVGPAFAILASRDPGRLLRDVTIRVPVELSPLRNADDLGVVVARAMQLGGSKSERVVAPVARAGGLSRDRNFFEVAARRFGTFQPVITDAPRRQADAAALVSRGISSLLAGTSGSVREAGLSFRQAIAADPFSNDGRFFESVTRLVGLLDDRTDRAAGIESFGELLDALGIPLGRKPVVARALSADWPARIRVVTNGPTQAEIVDFLTRVVRPELAAIRTGLLEVGDQFETRIDTSKLPYSLGAQRELDFGEVAFFRASVELLAVAIELFEAYDFDVDIGQLVRDFATLNIDALLAKYPNLGRPRAARQTEIAARLDALLTHVRDGFVAVEAETDDQSDDFLALSPSVPRLRREEFFESLQSLRASLGGSASETVRIGEQPGRVVVALGAFLAGGAADLRRLFPRFRSWLPVSIVDPTVGGLFPSLTATEATRRFGTATAVALVTKSIRVDGKLDDWPAACEVLLPADWVGDARGRGQVVGIDLTRVFLAIDSDHLYARIDVADDDPGQRDRSAVVLSIHGQDLTRRPDQRGIFEVRATLGKVSSVELRRPDVAPVTGSIVRADGVVELAVPIAPLRGAVRDRVLRVRSSGLDLRDGRAGDDATRRVIVTF